MRLTEEKVVEILADYVANRRPQSDLGPLWRLQPQEVTDLLSGKIWAHVPRPKGFRYPWPLKWTRYELSTPEEWQAECAALLQRYTDERWDVWRFAREAKIGYRQATKILLGRQWPSIPRPEGFVYPFPEHFKGNGRRRLTAEQVAEGLALFWLQGWCIQRLADHWSIQRHSAALIVHGRAYREVPRPWRRLTQAEIVNRSMVARWKARGQHDVHATGRGSEGSAAGTGAEG